jgi:hypothetical protein
MADVCPVPVDCGIAIQSVASGAVAGADEAGRRSYLGEHKLAETRRPFDFGAGWTASQQSILPTPAPSVRLTQPDPPGATACMVLGQLR